MAKEWTEPGWTKGQWKLPSHMWAEWRDRYMRGEMFLCDMCGIKGNVSLSPSRHVVNFSCGHVMELPVRTEV